jgi:hypothetical protein
MQPHLTTWSSRTDQTELDQELRYLQSKFTELLLN